MVSFYHTFLASITLSISLAPCFAQRPVIGCFDTGLVGDCSSFVSDFCSSLEAVEVVPQDTLSRCYDLGDFHCDLSAWFNGTSASSTDSFNPTRCSDSMTTASADCPMGGSGYFGINEFIFTIDPNAGACRSSAFPA